MLEEIKNLLLSQNPVSEHYLNRYIKLIQYAIENATKEEYKEKHHILPKSMFPDFKKEKWNIIKLSARQHFIAHWMLWRAYRNKEMTYAFNCMSKSIKKDLDGIRYRGKSSKMYENLKSSMIENGKNMWGCSDYRESMSEIRKEIWKRKSYREAHIKRAIERCAEPEYKENQSEKHSHFIYHLTKKSGEIIIAPNLRSWANENGYISVSLYNLLNKKINYHKDIIKITKTPR